MKDSLQEYLHAHIPLSKAMHLSVVDASASRVVLRAPLAPNVNHKGTAFGGSLQAAGLLACWSLAREALRTAGAQEFAIVVKECGMKFRLPVEDEFEAVAEISSDLSTAFAREFLSKGKARLTAICKLQQRGQTCATLNGVFVAIRHLK